MAVNRANQPGAPRFNFMWFWAVVAVVIIGYSMFGDSEARPLEGDWNMVDELVENGYVERIEVVDRENARVYLRAEYLDSLMMQPAFKDVPRTGAQVVFNTGGDVQYFAERLAAAEARAHDAGIEAEAVVVKYDRTEKGWMGYLFDALPFILMIFVFIFIMRSLSRNAGGGAGGGIMNVGKARAQMSDKNAKERVTF